MTERDLKEYEKLKKKAAHLQRRIDNIIAIEPDVVSGKVKGSSKKFPYTETRYSVQMYAPDQIQKLETREEKLNKKLNEITSRMDEIEEYVEDLDDVVLIEIFELYYLQGQSQKEVADKLYLDQSRVSRKIKEHWVYEHKRA